MKVVEYLEKSSTTPFSYEVIPPLRGGTAQKIFNLVEVLMPFDPPFIDVTSRAAEVYYEESYHSTPMRRVRRKRPGTLGLCAAIKNRFNVETVPHLLCHGFTKEETEDALIELNYLGINNVLAVTGDDTEREKNRHEKRNKNKFANELVEQIVALNSGLYLENLEDSYPTDFCIGVGGYPELHEDSTDFETDTHYLAQKVDAGADYIVTQMFFDNSNFIHFVERVRKAGIDIPIIPGLKILSSKSHLKLLPERFHVTIPDDLVNQVKNSDPKDVKRIGVKWALNQCQELLEMKVPCIHFYIMQSAKSVLKVVSEFK